jgi:MFS family permease
MADIDAHQTPAQREAAYDAFVEDNLRRNYTANFLHGMLGLTGFRLMYAPTLIPSYILQLTGSAALVGLGQGLLQTGAILSPIISARNVETRARILPYAIRVGSMMRLMIMGMALAGWFLPMGAWPLTAITLTLFFFLGIFSGSQRVAFQMLMSKVIPLTRRGRLQAYRNLTGGAIAALLSFFAGTWLIDNNVWGNGYATTFFVTVVLTSLGLFALQLLMREPDTLVIRRKTSFRERVSEFPALLQDRDYAWFLVAQGLTIAGRIAAPFYVIVASRQMPLDGWTIGILSVSFLGADTASNLLWGQMGDRLGFRSSFLLSVAVWIGALLLLINATVPWQVVVAFCGLGAASSGYMMSASTMVLEFGAREDTPMRIALGTTVEGSISAVGPLIGGIIVETAGPRVLMELALGFLVGALLVLLLRVREPRNRKAEPQLKDDLLISPEED